MKSMENNKKNEEQVKRITEMENILNNSTVIFENVNKALDELENNLKDYNKLDKYYSSANWFVDEEAYSNRELPEDLNCRSFIRRFSIQLIYRKQ